MVTSELKYPDTKTKKLWNHMSQQQQQIFL